MRRIVSLLPSATEILFAVGAGENVVAVSDQCDYPPAATTLPRVTRSRIDSAQSSRDIDAQTRERLQDGQALYVLDQRQLVALRPDLIVTQSQCEVCAVRYADVVELIASEPDLRHTQIVALNPSSLDEVLDDILRLGVSSGRSHEAQSLASALRDRMYNVRRAASWATSRPTVACIEWFDPIMTAGNWVPQLIELAGGVSVLAEAGAHSAYVPWEAIVACDPEVLILMPCGFDLPRVTTVLGELTLRPGWSGLRAVRGDRVFAVDSSAYFLRSGPRLVDSLEMLVNILHPVLASQAAVAAHRHGWQRCSCV